MLQLVRLGVVLGFVTSANAGLVDVFALTLEQPVSNGVPSAGAGNIETPGAIDQYTFTLAESSTLFFDEQAGGCAIVWHCDGPNGSVFSSDAICVADPGTKVLAAGEYTITVQGSGAATGTYGFEVWNVNRADAFVIGLEQAVSNGVPGAGAGNIEEPGSIDVYTLTLDRATNVYVDEQGANCQIVWKCDGPRGAVFALQTMCVVDPAAFALDAGTYTFTVSGGGSTTGTYGFKVWEINAPQEFTIGLDQVVSNGVPAAGAGFIEEPAAQDIYHLDLALPTTVYFDEISAGCSILWSCVGPRGTVFAAQTMCVVDPGAIALLDTGQYTITVVGQESTVGAYSFELVQVSAPQVFDIAFGDVVSLDAPARGAGNIEEAGAIDVYRMPVRGGDDICFVELDGGCGIYWNVQLPDDSTAFANNVICVSGPASVLMPRDGLCTITVFASQSAVGTYSFTTRLRSFADVDGDCSVGAADLAILLGAWGACDGCASDLDDSGAVDASDLALLLGAWS